MATPTTGLPDQQAQQQQPQQQQQQPSIYPQASASLSSSSNGGAWHSSGSVGPFFVVMAVLTVLTVLSCLVSRFCVGRTTTAPPLDIRCGDCFWWLRKKCNRCVISHDDIEVGEKAVSRKDFNNGKSLKGIDETDCSPPLST